MLKCAFESPETEQRRKELYFQSRLICLKICRGRERNNSTYGWGSCCYQSDSYHGDSNWNPSERGSSGRSSAHFPLWAKAAHGGSRSKFSFLKEPLCSKNHVFMATKHRESCPILMRVIMRLNGRDEGTSWEQIPDSIMLHQCFGLRVEFAWGTHRTGALGQ